jgi:hypothetical protein
MTYPRIDHQCPFRRLRESNRELILVTGRLASDYARGLSRFEAVVLKVGSRVVAQSKPRRDLMSTGNYSGLSTIFEQFACLRRNIQNRSSADT